MLKKYFSSYGQHNISQDGFGLFGELINQTAFLHRVVVKEDDRGKGIGLKLIKDFIAEARRKGCKKVKFALDPTLTNRDKKIFSKLGFELVDEKINL